LVRVTDVARIGIPPNPIRFELTRNPATGWSARSDYAHIFYFEVRTDSIARWGRDLFTSWIRIAGAEPTILISRPPPTAGLEMAGLETAGFYLRLALRGADLAGTITAFTDFVPSDGKAEASHAIRAHRIACPVPHR
jgi:hypothetical protein